MTDSGATEKPQGGLFSPALTAFSVACATLLLQLVQTRIFSVVFWNHLVYFIVSIALLGFGISGTWLSFGTNSRLARLLTLPRSAVLFFITSIVASLYIPRLGISMASLVTDTSNIFQLILTYVAAVLPYFFAGWMLGVIYRNYTRNIHFLYFADLVGAAAGCIIFLVFIRPLTAVGLVLLAAGMVAFPALFLSGRSWRSVTFVVLCALALWYYIDHVDELNAGIVPEETKALEALYEPQILGLNDVRMLEFSEWNPISRIDVASSFKFPKNKRIFIDGDAWTGIMVDQENPAPPWNPEVDRLFTWGSPYLLRPSPEDVLVVGSGGGIDVYNALRAGAKKIDAVEINPTTARIVKDEYAEETKTVFEQPEVTLWTEEGRSFVRRGGAEYDVIMMNAIDTFSALNAGAYVLSESYLYTVDAMKDYVSHLKPDGILSISRWKTPAESVRLFTVVLEAMYELGYEHPERHIIAIFTPYQGFIGVMAGRTEFSDAEVAKVQEHCERTGAVLMFPLANDEYEYAIQRIYAQYAEMRKTDPHPPVVVDLMYDARPVWDDSPFFFNFLTVHQLSLSTRASTAAQILRGNWSSLTLFSLFFFLLFAILVFMLAPLLKYGRGHIPHFKSWLVYFTCLGLSFIFVEIAMMQRFALLLGHPSRSLALVLATLLLFAGIGSHARGRFRVSLRLSLSLLVGAILVAAFVYPYLITFALGWSLTQRAYFTVLLVAPLGFFMGMPFPEGLRMVSEHGSEAVPWMWGVNGGATVLGSVVAIILAMAFNFTTVFVLAALGYFIALALYHRLGKAVSI